MFGNILAITMTLLMCNKNVFSEPPSQQYGVPFGDQNNGYNNHINNHNHNNYDANYNNGNHNHNNYDDHSEPKAYEFGYQVKDDYTGTNYNRQESSDGNQVTGEYRVQLPDGRMQIVTYYADWQTGFHADVRYEGTATYPETYKTNGGYQQGGGVSNQYGTPNYNNGYNSDYNNYNNNGGHPSASSAVSINNLSGPGAPYNVNNNNNHNNGYTYNNPNNNFNNNYK